MEEGPPGVVVNEGGALEEVKSLSSPGKGFHRPNWQNVKKNAQRKFISTVDRIVSLSRRNSSVNSIQKLLSDPSERPCVTLGPVIGKVTDTSARILLEISESASVVMVLEGAPREAAEFSSTDSNAKTGSVDDLKGQRPCQVRKTLTAYRPGIFVFENLIPGTKYRVKMKECDLKQTSSFRTFPADVSSSVNFAAISCNKIFITEKEIPVHSDLWAHLAKTIELGKIDMCLHLGDQIYGDGDKMLDAAAGEKPDDWSDCFKKSKALLEALTPDQWKQQHEQICEFYREVYRKTWSHTPTAYCLANSPNLMIYDDHEIRDNWADVAADCETTSLDFFIAKCAWKVNVEYQRQLHEDVEFNKLDLIDKDYHFHVVSGVGIMFLDIRGSRTFHRDANDPNKYLGTRQWQDIKKALNGGIFESVRVLLLCTPAPLVFLEHTVTDVAAKTVQRLEDFKGHWSAAPHFEEQKQMIDCLCEWQLSLSGRVVLVLGGDVHCGGHSEVLKDRKVVFRQLTTSAIANHPLPKSAYYALRAAGRMSGVAKNVVFRHHDWTRSRNYGLVYVKQATTIPEVTSQLIKGKFMIGIREGVKVSNLRDSSSGCVGCFT